MTSPDPREREEPRPMDDEKERLAQALRDGDDATFIAAVREANRPAATDRDYLSTRWIARNKRGKR